jgi:hypothetical protein
MDCWQEFRRLEEEGTAVAEPHLRDGVLYAIDSAERNAMDTLGMWTVTNNNDYFRIAYGSIASTAAFEDPQVKQWFLDRGYRY